MHAPYSPRQISSSFFNPSWQKNLFLILMLSVNKDAAVSSKRVTLFSGRQLLELPWTAPGASGGINTRRREEHRVYALNPWEWKVESSSLTFLCSQQRWATEMPKSTQCTETSGASGEFWLYSEANALGTCCFSLPAYLKIAVTWCGYILWW